MATQLNNILPQNGSSGQNALTCFNLSFQTRSVVTKFFPKMVLQFSTSKTSEQMRPMSKRLEQERGIKNAKTDAYYQKMALTYNITFFIGIAVFLVLGFLINVTLLSIFIKMLPRPCC